jgi:hypothetical protein
MTGPLIFSPGGSYDFQTSAMVDASIDAAISVAMAPVCAAPTIAAAVVQLGEIGTVTSSTPALQFNINEALTTGGGFYDPIVVNHRRDGGTGHRQAFTAQITTSGATASEFLVGSAGFGFLDSGSGEVFGGNTYSRTLAPVAATASCVSFEADTDVYATIARKNGIQIVDVATSVADGTLYSAGLYIAKQVGALGYRNGIVFGDDVYPNMGPASGALIRVAPNSGTVVRGIDFRTATFSGAALALLGNGAGVGAISWSDAAGGSIQSQTAAAGPTLIFGNAALSINKTSAGTQCAVFGTGATPSFSIDVGGLGLKAVTAGAADSAGVGFRQLRIPN